MLRQISVNLVAHDQCSMTYCSFDQGVVLLVHLHDNNEQPTGKYINQWEGEKHFLINSVDALFNKFRINREWWSCI